MTLPVLSAWFLAGALGAFLLSLLRLPRPLRARNLRAVGLAAVVMVALTIVFDNVMIGAKLFDYHHARLLGWYVGQAPVEDLAYAVCGLLTAVAVRNILPPPRRGTRVSGPEEVTR